MELGKNQLMVTWFDDDLGFQLHPAYQNLCQWVRPRINRNPQPTLVEELKKFDADLSFRKEVRDPLILTFPDEETLVSWVLTWS